MKVVSVCMLIFAFLFSGCGECLCRTRYEYLHTTDEIETIEIVVVTFGDDSPPYYDVLYTVEDIDGFIEDFGEIKCYEQVTHPLGIDDGDTVIKITYENGDYELVTWDGRATFVKGIFYGYKGWQYFDEGQFQSLLDKYLPNES